MNRSPLILNQDDGGYGVEYEGKVILDWNARLSKMAMALEQRHAGVTTFVHDTWGVFDSVIKDPKSFEQTSGLKNVTAFCKAYAK